MMRSSNDLDTAIRMDGGDLTKPASSLPEYDSDEETVATVIYSSWASRRGSSSDLSLSPESSESRSSWWNLDDDDEPLTPYIENKSKTPTRKSSFPRWRNPLADEEPRSFSKKTQSEKLKSRFSWWNLGDEELVPSSKSSGKVDARAAIKNSDKELQEKKKKTKSGKKKKSKTDKKKSKKSKRRSKKDKKQLSMEEIEQESKTFDFDAARAFKLNVRKLQTIMALQKCFEDNQTAVAQAEEDLKTKFSWWDLHDEELVPAGKSAGNVDAKVAIRKIVMALQKKNKLGIEGRWW